MNGPHQYGAVAVRRYQEEVRDLPPGPRVRSLCKPCAGTWEPNAPRELRAGVLVRHTDQMDHATDQSALPARAYASIAQRDGYAQVASL